MKKIVLIFALTIGILAQAQKGKQEASLDIGDAIVMKSLELTYEYYVLENSSAGISTYFGFAKESSDFRYNESVLISPFFRHYFSDHTWRPFGEVFFGFGGGKRKRKLNDVVTIHDFSDQAIGVSGGLKYVSDAGLTLSGIAGVGRYLFNAKAEPLEKSPLLVLRFGINVGYQF